MGWIHMDPNGKYLRYVVRMTVMFVAGMLLATLFFCARNLNRTMIYDFNLTVMCILIYDYYYHLSWCCVALLYLSVIIVTSASGALYSSSRNFCIFLRVTLHI